MPLSALQGTPEVLQSISVDLSVNVLLGMVDDLVDVAVSGHAVIRAERVSVERRADFDVLSDDLLKLMLLAIRNDLSADLAPVAVTLEQSHDGDLPDHRLRLRDAETLALGRVHVARLTADESFVGFDAAVQFPAVLGLKRQTQPRQHEPRGFLSDAKRTRQFVGANPVLAGSEQPERGQPLFKANRGVFEDGSDFERELRLGVFPVALVTALSGQIGDVIRPARLGRSRHHRASG